MSSDLKASSTYARHISIPFRYITGVSSGQLTSYCSIQLGVLGTGFVSNLLRIVTPALLGLHSLKFHFCFDTHNQRHILH
jgi:hypothetical protein